jgi:hypothetical protein
MSAAAKFQERLGAEVTELLGSGHRFLKSRTEIQTAALQGHNVVILSGSNKYSPFVDVAFYFGKNFAAAKALERKHGLHQFLYHVQQYSRNRASFSELSFSGPCTWSVDITSPPPNLAQEVASAIRGLAEPFFSRFEDLRAARDALAADDPWCFGGPAYWRQLLHLDLALGDLEHFDAWSTCLDDFSRGQARERIAKVLGGH